MRRWISLMVEFWTFGNGICGSELVRTDCILLQYIFLLRIGLCLMSVVSYANFYFSPQQVVKRQKTLPLSLRSEKLPLKNGSDAKFSIQLTVAKWQYRNWKRIKPTHTKRNSLSFLLRSEKKTHLDLIGTLNFFLPGSREEEQERKRKMDRFIDDLPPMDLMRSEKMMFVQLIIPVESAQRAVSYLGELGLLQFRDVSVLSTQIRVAVLNCVEMNLCIVYLFAWSR